MDSSLLTPDYVIIGAGICGMVLAARLSEDPNISVGVLEAGGDVFHDENIDTPAYIVRNLGDSAKDWGFFSTPQEHINNATMYLPRGKGIGGSSLINFMMLTRAPSVEYDAFGLLGSPGWSWEEFLKYFKKSESFSYSEEQAATYYMKFDKRFHGTSGPLKKTFPNYIDEFALPWLQATKAIGISSNPDPSDGDNTGFWTATKAIDSNAIRSSAATAYYEGNRSRSNLKILTDARVTRIITDTAAESGKTVARAVEYSQSGILQTLSARKEVIICAGSYQTPQILELSGIGDPTIIKKYDIPVVIDLEGVGKNLREEHVNCTFTVEMNNGYQTFDSMQDPVVAREQEEIYTVDRSGMLSSVPSAYAFLPFEIFDNNGSIAKKAQELTLKQNVSASGLKTFNYQKEWILNNKVPFLDLNMFDRFMPGLVKTPEAGKKYLSISIIALHPFNRGSVHIGSADPLASPNIDINVLDNEVDFDILVEGYKLARKIVAAEPLKSQVAQEISPGIEYQTDDEIKSYIRQTVGTTYHPVATSSMLPREDGGCVDANLKVYGTTNLRVVDASVIPIQIAAHPSATLYALGEKAADLIKQQA